MARQLQAKDVLIFGDSNVRRNLTRAGRSYSQSAVFRSARSLTEFSEAVKVIETDTYKIVIFAMLTNIVVDAGSSAKDHLARIQAITDCLEPLFKDLR
jgi:hypothetical protein